MGQMIGARGRELKAIVAALALAAAGAACASSGHVRPSAFPGAPPAPAGVALPSEAGGSATSAARVRSAVLTAALAMRGRPYRLGGDEPDRGFDCSGLVQYAFQQEHIALPRTVAEQASVGVSVRPRDVVPGDLLFFAIHGRRATHVGIAIDTATFIHAPDRGGVVRVERSDAPYWRTRLVGVRRVLR